MSLDGINIALPELNIQSSSCASFSFLCKWQLSRSVKNDRVRTTERKNEGCFKYISRIDDNEN